MKRQQQVVDANGVQLFCERIGSGETLVLVHGGGGDHRHWDEQFQALAAHFDVIRYDLRGYGQSNLPIEGQPYRHQDDLIDLLDTLGVTRAHIAGYSLGSQVVVDTYTLAPHLFQSIITAGPFVSGHTSSAVDDLFGGYAACGSLFREKGALAAGDAFPNIPAFNPKYIAAGAKERVAEVAREYSWWWADHEDPLEPLEPPATEVLKDIHVPVLTITAEYDARACLEVADLMEEQIPQISRVDIPGATHFMLIEQPRVFNSAIIDFIKGI
jgi:pimeloyl-ACP methyl ester carboxylesterase